MKCVICKHGETRPGTATLTADRGGSTLVIRNVPALICDNCGEEYFDEETTTRVLRQVEGLSEAGVQVEIRRYTSESP
ncbi:MAG: type II toxin-antitoxin system MqsA family antitoxin [Myxococcales bacterium]|nr:MAG: type II toxin-antitoxin system MqsA family antitoxin [Myxococcales bacterium]